MFYHPDEQLLKAETDNAILSVTRAMSVARDLKQWSQYMLLEHVMKTLMEVSESVAEQRPATNRT